jgi:outer membrane receptor protein involved in Fe transport
MGRLPFPGSGVERHLCWFSVCLFLVVLSLSIQAQTALTGGLRGFVTDSNGAAVSGAVVKLENKSLSFNQETVTGADGRFVFLNLVPASDYEMQVAANGFKTLTRNGITVISSEAAAVDAQLEVAAVTETVDVNSTGEAQLSQSAELSQNIDEKQLNNLPLYNRNLNRAALLDPHVRNTQGLGGDGGVTARLSINGRIYRETHYKLDGNANFDAYTNNEPLQAVSLSAVQEYKILTNQYSAEHGGTTAGFLLATTKSGTKDFRGEAFFLGRPSGIQARPPLSNIRIPNQRLQFGGSLSGPLYKDRTLFFLNYEGTRQDRGSFISIPAPGFYVGNLRENLGLFKVDHRFADNHTLSVRLNGSRTTNNNVNDRITFNSQPAAPQALPSTAAFSYTQAAGVQLNDNYVIGSNIVNEFRVSYTNAIPSASRPVTPGIVIIRPGISTEGNGTFSEFRLQNTQIVEQMSVQTGRHSFKFGGDYTRQQVNDRSYQAFGTYTLDITGKPVRFQQQLSREDLTYGQSRFAAFVQDDWRVSSQLTLNLGLRYDYQSIIKDYNNFGPRLGFAYDIGGTGDTVVRGGAGMYYDQPFFHGFTQRYLLNDTSLNRGAFELLGNAAEAFFPNSLDVNSFDPRSPLLQRIPRSLFLKGDDLTSPYTLQFSIGVQRKLFNDWVVNADYVHNISRGLLTAFNINAPSPFVRTAPGQRRSADEANATRPFSTYQGVSVRDVLVSNNAGRSEYDALSLGLTKRFGNRYTFAANYVLSEAKDAVTDDHLGANPNEWNDVINAEYAPSDFNQKHRFVAYGAVALPFETTFSLVATAASGIRINPITGVDNNGDGRLVDRPAGFARNSFAGKSQTRLDASLSKSFRVGIINETARFEIRGDVFNLFNNSNFYRFTNIYGNEANPNRDFAQPVGGVSNVDPGRQIQFMARFIF